METHMWLYKTFQDKKCQDFMSQRSKVFPKFLGCSPHFHKSLDPKRGSQFKAKISWLYIQKPKTLFDRSNRFAYNCRLNHQFFFQGASDASIITGETRGHCGWDQSYRTPVGISAFACCLQPFLSVCGFMYHSLFGQFILFFTEYRI